MPARALEARAAPAVAGRAPWGEVVVKGRRWLDLGEEEMVVVVRRVLLWKDVEGQASMRSKWYICGRWWENCSSLCALVDAMVGVGQLFAQLLLMASDGASEVKFLEAARASGS